MRLAPACLASIPACFAVRWYFRAAAPASSWRNGALEDYFETFVRIYDEHFSRQYGFWRPYVEQVIHRYLDCGDPHNGFARVKCKDCGHEYRRAFFLKCDYFQLLIFNVSLSFILISCRCTQ